ncbi:PH domain-containing protein [Nocardia testacea]|uniref:PH domain-containing protein n=1 Tax=Nocardia testacea TaxID=248551 RepID=UPI003A83D6C9
MIRTTRLSFLGVFILAMCVFFPIVGWPAGLFWLALIPIAVLVWILRTQTRVSPAGLDLRSVFSSRHIDWAQVKGLSIPKRGFVRAHLDDDSEVPLPAVSYDRLRDLVDASGGRIPDPFVLPDPAPAADDDDTAPDDATHGAGDSAPTKETGRPAPADATPADPAHDDSAPTSGTGRPTPADSAPAGAAPAGAAPAGAASDDATPPAAGSGAAPAHPASDEAASDDTASGDAKSGGPAPGRSGETRTGSADPSATPRAADTGPGPTSERE